MPCIRLESTGSLKNFVSGILCESTDSNLPILSIRLHTPATVGSLMNLLSLRPKQTHRTSLKTH